MDIKNVKQANRKEISQSLLLLGAAFRLYSY